jgi:acyl carrier protein
MIEDKVMEIIAENTSATRSAITMDSTFEELKLDSMDALNVVFALEEEFKITISEEAVRSFSTVRQAVDEVTMLIATAEKISSSGAEGKPGG